MTTLILMAIGAALMYFFDPDSGRSRRKGLRDKCTRTTKKFQGSARTLRKTSVIVQPTAIGVTADQGRVTLSGPVSAEEETALLACVRSVPGVTGVENRLEVVPAATTV